MQHNADIGGVHSAMLKIASLVNARRSGRKPSPGPNSAAARVQRRVCAGMLLHTIGAGHQQAGKACRPAGLTAAAAGLQVQFHAVALLHALRAGDRLAVSKLVAGLTRGSSLGPAGSGVRSPLAQCLLVRYVAQVAPPRPSFTGAAAPAIAVMAAADEPANSLG